MFCGFPQSVFFFLYWTMEFGNNFKDMPAQTEEGWIWMNFYLLTCRQGVILDQAYGGPSSVPGKAALLTGRYSSRLSLLSQPKTYLFCHFFPRSTAFPYLLFFQLYHFLQDGITFSLSSHPWADGSSHRFQTFAKGKPTSLFKSK